MEEIIEKLIECGLTYKEAKVYYTLCKLGPCKASLLAHHLQIPRPEIYIVLKKLQERRFIEVTLERPMRFIAVSFERVIDQIIEEEKEKIEEMKSILKRSADLNFS